jgi:hypothetical protein
MIKFMFSSTPQTCIDRVPLKHVRHTACVEALTPWLPFMQISSSSPIGHPSLLPAAEGARRVVVWLRITKPAATITLLSDDRTRTFARVEAAAPGCAVGIAGARTGDELRSSTVSSAVAAGRCLGGDGGSGSGRVGRCLPEQDASCVIIRLRITKSTASVTLLSDDRACTFARVEAAAAGCAVGVASARTSNELCALTNDQKSH